MATLPTNFQGTPTPAGPGISPMLFPPVGGLTVQQAILYRALRLAGITRGPGRTANVEQFNDALIALNGLIAYLNSDRKSVV